MVIRLRSASARLVTTTSITAAIMDFAISAKCAPFRLRSHKPFGNDLDVADEVRLPDIVERIEHGPSAAR